jgi:foldase protein PrsA
MREESGRRATDVPIPADRAAFEREVLDRMIESVLIEQAAEAAGITLSEDELSDEVTLSIEDAGGGQSWNDWLTMSNLTPQEYREQLRIQLLGGMMIAQIATEVPEVAEQVHARHILVDSQATAQDVLDQLQSGTDFAELAGRYSQDTSTRETGGDLSWFARGQLLESEVEDATFSLQPGEIGPIITSRLGYHIVQTLERDPARPLDDEARETLLQIALERWRQELWERADIQRFVGAGS